MMKANRKNSGLRVFGDAMSLLFMAVTGILFLILVIINDTAKKNAEAQNPQGNIIVELYWPDELDTDIDLWVRGEADNTPVGYNNKGGPLFNLLRDDLGVLGDISGKNQEITYSRGVPDGEYVINAHLFALKSGKLPIPFTLVVSLKKDEQSTQEQLFKVTGNLTEQGQERTIARFYIQDMKYIPESFNTIQEQLRSPVASAM